MSTLSDVITLGSTTQAETVSKNPSVSSILELVKEYFEDMGICSITVYLHPSHHRTVFNWFNSYDMDDDTYYLRYLTNHELVRIHYDPSVEKDKMAVSIANSK